MSKTKVLLVASNPDSTTSLSLLKEVREIENSINSSYFRDAFELFYCPAARASDLRKKVLDIHPEIIHFCAHGSQSGIYLENDAGTKNLVLAEQLNFFLQKVSSIQCIVFNTCDSLNTGKHATKYVPAVICFNGKLADKAAISFSKGFYESLARGLDVKESYSVGLTAIAMDADTRDSEASESQRSLYSKDKDNGIHRLARGYSLLINNKKYNGKSGFMYISLVILLLLVALIYIIEVVIV